MDRKNICQLPLIGLLVLSLNIQAQNLVPNTSFEYNTECPEHTGRIINALPWYSVRSSCDYYHECGSGGANIPISYGGGYARTGQAYAGFKVWCINDGSGVNREILGVELTEALVEGYTYRVEFYLSMSDSMWYASQNVGAYFSVEQPNEAIDSIESYQPQVWYNGDFITDKEGWTRVSGSFVAQGEEKFMSIGNFDKFEDTEVLFVPGGGVAPSHSSVYWSCSEYFIDDVSVVPDSITAVREEAMNIISVFPNPVRDVLHIEGERLEQIRLFDISGREVSTSAMPQGRRNWSMDVSHLPQGVYLLEVWFEEGRKAVHKVVRSE
jgi:hypothetical protein